MRDKTAKKTRIILSVAIFAMLFSLAFTVGNAMYSSGSSSSLSNNPLHWVLLFLIVLAVSFLAVIFLFVIDFEKHDGKLKKSRKLLLCLWLLFFICYIPCFIAYFPGIWSYDISTQIGEFGGNYTSHHPPLHTFLLEICTRLFSGDYSRSIPFYGICQMLFISFAFAKSVCFMTEKRTPIWIVVISIMFYALNPVLALFSFIPIKDVVCAGFFILLTVEICKLITNPGNYLSSVRDMTRFVLLSLLFCLFRNNAVYALIVTAIIAFLVFKNHRVRSLLIFAVPVALYFFVSVFIFSALGIKKGSSAEMFSVPLQQISRVVCTDESSLTDYDKEEISKFLPYDSIKDKYNRRFADPIKDEFDNSYGIKPLVKEWFRLMPSHLTEYLDAFLDLHIPYWYPAASAKDPVSGVLYIETNYRYLVSGPPFWNADLLPSVRDVYEDVADYSAFEDLPQLLNPFALSFALWFMLFCMFRLIASNICRGWFVICLPLMFFGTYLLGPVSNLRYIIPLVMQYPLFLAVSFAPKHILS